MIHEYCSGDYAVTRTFEGVPSFGLTETLMDSWGCGQ